jgi:hypothetical protein
MHCSIQVDKVNIKIQSTGSFFPIFAKPARQRASTPTRTTPEKVRTNPAASSIINLASPVTPGGNLWICGSQNASIPTRDRNQPGRQKATLQLLTDPPPAPLHVRQNMTTASIINCIKKLPFLEAAAGARGVKFASGVLQHSSGHFGDSRDALTCPASTSSFQPFLSELDNLSANRAYLLKVLEGVCVSELPTGQQMHTAPSNSAEGLTCGRHVAVANAEVQQSRAEAECNGRTGVSGAKGVAMEEGGPPSTCDERTFAVGMGRSGESALMKSESGAVSSDRNKTDAYLNQIAILCEGSAVQSRAFEVGEGRRAFKRRGSCVDFQEVKEVCELIRDKARRAGSAGQVAWVQKYAPERAGEVLGNAGVAEVLRGWLEVQEEAEETDAECGFTLTCHLVHPPCPLNLNIRNLSPS